MRVIGLMSGTSADGIDAALVRVGRRGVGLAVRLEAFRHVAYPPAVRRRLLAAADGAAIGAAELGRDVGERHAAAVIGLCRRSRTPLAAIDLVSCHGHTLHHDPARGRVTMQIGDAALVAVRTGITTIADFRGANSSDPAATGSVRPLVLGKIVPGENYERVILRARRR